MEGFKTCADVDKAEAEGAFVLYSTDPEQGQVKLLASFNKLFPKIKTSYVRLQAGALYAKVLSERQAKSYLVDVIQISDMGMILDFQRQGGFRQYISPEMAARRVAGDAVVRPLLAGGPARERLEAILGARRPLYAETAEVRVPTDDRTTERVADAVIEALGMGA